MQIRLQKWISQSGVASRRKAEELIQSGKVAVNGIIITELGAKADTIKDVVSLDGKVCEPTQQQIYIALHKPEGVITSVTDPYNRKTVMDYLPNDIHCYPVGRLDYDTSGLLILTNDGALAQQLTHPKNRISKTYIATVKGFPTKATLITFQNGIIIDEKPTAPCEIEIIKKLQTNTKVRIKIKEGRNRQVRKMCEAIGHDVISLKRVEVGHVKLENLPKGQWRYLSEKEVRQFK